MIRNFTCRLRFQATLATCNMYRHRWHPTTTITEQLDIYFPTEYPKIYDTPLNGKHRAIIPIKTMKESSFFFLHRCQSWFDCEYVRQWPYMNIEWMLSWKLMQATIYIPTFPYSCSLHPQRMAILLPRKKERIQPQDCQSQTSFSIISIISNLLHVNYIHFQMVSTNVFPATHIPSDEHKNRHPNDRIYIYKFQIC